MHRRFRFVRSIELPVAGATISDVSLTSNLRPPLPPPLPCNQIAKYQSVMNYVASQIPQTRYIPFVSDGPRFAAVISLMQINERTTFLVSYIVQMRTRSYKWTKRSAFRTFITARSYRFKFHQMKRARIHRDRIVNRKLSHGLDDRTHPRACTQAHLSLEESPMNLS